MTIKRIVSFLPSATELLYELGAQENLYGVTHKCRFPHQATAKPQVISSVIDSDGLSSKEIDALTCRLLHDGEDIFVLNEKNLKEARPDLIIYQETCTVCAAHTGQVGKAVQILEKKPILHSMDPHNLAEIVDSVTELGRILERDERAQEITNSLKRRIEKIKSHGNGKRPKVLAIEWIEPFFTAGHWVPEMIETAGGVNLIGRTGERSRRLDLQDLKNAEPDIIIMMPCGFDTQRTISEYEKILKHDEKWNKLDAVKNSRVYAVDADSFFSKPSIRTVEGLEILAKIIRPERFANIVVPSGSFSHMG